MEKYITFDARIQTPTNIIVSGPTQSGKTEWTIKLIDNMHRLLNPIPQKIYWFYGIYTNSIDRLKKDKNKKIIFIEGIPKNGFNEFRSGTVAQNETS